MRNQAIQRITVAGAAAFAVVAGVAFLGDVGDSDANAQLPLSEVGALPALGSFAATPADERLAVAELRVSATEQCMEAAGHKVDLPRPVIHESPDPYGRLRADWVAVHGYGVPPELSVGDQGLAESMSPEAVKTLWGDLDDPTDGGCLTAGRQAVFGESDDFDNARLTLEGLSNTALSTAMDDDRYTLAIERWSTCMSESGFPATSFGDAIESYSADDVDDIGTAPASEIAAATADLECRTTTEVNDTLERLHLSLQEQAATNSEAASAIQTYDSVWREAVERADQ